MYKYYDCYLYHKCSYIVFLSSSFVHKTRNTPVFSPSYRNSARTTCMLSPPFGHITIPVWRYLRRSYLPLSDCYYLQYNRYLEIIGVPLGRQRNQLQATYLFVQKTTLDIIFTNLVTMILSLSFDAVNQFI